MHDHRRFVPGLAERLASWRLGGGRRRVRTHRRQVPPGLGAARHGPILRAPHPSADSEANAVILSTEDTTMC